MEKDKYKNYSFRISWNSSEKFNPREEVMKLD